MALTEQVKIRNTKCVRCGVEDLYVSEDTKKQITAIFCNNCKLEDTSKDFPMLHYFKGAKQ